MSDIAASCFGCRTIFLLEPAPQSSGLAGGTAAAARCPDCGELMLALDAAEDQLAAVVTSIRGSGSLHYATLLQLVESWELARPLPLQALAELRPVAPEIVAAFGLDETVITNRMACGTMLIELLLPLLRAAVGHEPPLEVARRVVERRFAPTRQRSVTNPAAQRG